MAKEFKEKTITINLSRVFEKPTTKRSIAAKHIICKKVEKETRLKEFKISNELNETLWSRGRYSSPRKIIVKVVKDKTIARIMLPSEKYEPKEAKKAQSKTAEKKDKEETPKEAEEKKDAPKKEETPKTKKE
ncbi:MAG: hypothetical protein PHY04_02500 [Candidatus ainarchaeum sp.]|nr:hypothetical protein [Candidatus ainarchaeum sp.]MDD4468084.1 hypothetical protein [Candidatus ainarchaeum sp.]